MRSSNTQLSSDLHPVQTYIMHEQLEQGWWLATQPSHGYLQLAIVLPSGGGAPITPRTHGTVSLMPRLRLRPLCGQGEIF